VPHYDYECTHCGNKFEASQKMTDKPLEKCPKCGKKVKRLISGGSGLIFKGSGFYATDYKKKGKGAPAAPVCPKAKQGCDGCSKGQ